MFYLVRPDMRLQWVNLPVKTTLEIIEKHGGNLDRVEWLDADRLVDQYTVLLALRHGIACSVGIAVPAVVFTTVDRPVDLAKTYRDLVRAESAVAVGDEVLEKVMPGWKASGEKLAEEVRRSTEDSIKKAQVDADALLAADPKPELVEHWSRIGGIAG
ncbi:hypothetical protein EU811_22235 [Arthrobacter sp. TS-15]|uniref:hypothetical protein n=1 Tax=unclassified Arthrobacter TaxID=235627 RepID=UPI00115D66D2|nr:MULTISPECIES: hypothetical protein [unclassified Arthrobacter]QSZ51227.1 hypothetical protein AYX22_22050 [Arthrobacter sp. D5-1]TQS87559.1 hypothetical protein EU811_22235 [Arthrobacter sp. TS-15]